MRVNLHSILAHMKHTTTAENSEVILVTRQILHVQNENTHV